MVRPSVRPRRSRAFRPAETALSLLEPRKLMATLATASPHAAPALPQDQQAQPIQHEALLLDSTATAQEADPGYSGPVATAPPTPKQAIDLIENSPWGKTPPGQKIVKLLRDDDAGGKIKIGKLDPDPNGDPVHGQYDDETGFITIDSPVAGDVGSLATALVHEGSHQQWDKDNGAGPTTLDEEYDAFKNQVLFFGGLTPDQKPKDPDFREENQGLLDSYKNGDLRGLVQKVYKDRFK